MYSNDCNCADCKLIRKLRSQPKRLPSWQEQQASAYCRHGNYVGGIGTGDHICGACEDGES